MPLNQQPLGPAPAGMNWVYNPGTRGFDLLPEHDDQHKYVYHKDSGQVATEKKGSLLGTLGKIGMAAGQIGLAAATGGMSIPAQIAINAAAGAGLGALNGGGLKGAALGALGGGATVGLGHIPGLGGAAGGVTNAAEKAGSSMNFGNILGSVLKNPDTYTNIAGVVAGAGKGAAAERANENVLANSQFATQQNALLNLLGLQERATMDRARMGIAAPQARMKQALLASLLQHAQPVSISGLPPGVTVPKTTGGLSPALIDNATRGGAGELQRQALLALLTKSDVPAPTDYATSGRVAAPGYKGPGVGESILSGIGTGGALLGALTRSRQPQMGAQ